MSACKRCNGKMEDLQFTCSKCGNTEWSGLLFCIILDISIFAVIILKKDEWVKQGGTGFWIFMILGMSAVTIFPVLQLIKAVKNPVKSKKYDSKDFKEDISGLVNILPLIFILLIFTFRTSIANTVIFYFGKFVAFSIGIGYFLSLLFIWILSEYMPSGRGAVASHKWVIKGSDAVVKDATVRDVYEHHHGHGSWWRKVEAQWKAIRLLGFIVVSASPYLIGYSFHFIRDNESRLQPLIALLCGGIIYVSVNGLLDIKFSPPSPSGTFQPDYSLLGKTMNPSFITMMILTVIVQPLSALIFIAYYFLNETWQSHLAWLYWSSLLLFVGSFLVLFLIKSAEDGKK